MSNFIIISLGQHIKKSLDGIQFDLIHNFFRILPERTFRFICALLFFYFQSFLHAAGFLVFKLLYMDCFHPSYSLACYQSNNRLLPPLWSYGSLCRTILGHFTIYSSDNVSRRFMYSTTLVTLVLLFTHILVLFF